MSSCSTSPFSLVRARSTSSSVTGVAAKPSITPSSASRAGSIGESLRTAAPKYAEPGSRVWRSAPKIEAALPLSTSALCSRPVGWVDEDLGEDVDRDEIRMRPRGHVVHRVRELHVADAAQDDAALAVLRRLDRVGRPELPRRLGDGAEGLRRRRERALGVELAGDDQHRVVGLVVVAVERLQALDRHVLDVRQRADHRAAVVVPEVGGGAGALAEEAERAVLAGLELVADHGHLAVEVLLRDAGVDHAVGLEAEHERERVVARREGLEVVGAVERGGAVVARAALEELVLRVGDLRRALEEQVLEEVRHAALAVALVPGADEVGDVGGDRVLGGVGEEQDFHPVREVVLGDAAHRRAAGDAGREGLGSRRECGEQQGERREERGTDSWHRLPPGSGRSYRSRTLFYKGFLSRDARKGSRLEPLSQTGGPGHHPGRSDDVCRIAFVLIDGRF